MNSVERAAQLSADKMQKIVTTATSNLSTMQTAISESMSNTGVTADTLKSLMLVPHQIMSKVMISQRKIFLLNPQKVLK